MKSNDPIPAICEICETTVGYFYNNKRPGSLIEHHIIPRKYGGTDDKENIIYLCTTCHADIHALYNRFAIEEIYKTNRSFFKDIVRTAQISTKETKKRHFAKGG